MLPARFRRQVVHLLSHPADQSGSVAKELTPLLEDINSKDWKIVYLARDPRGVMASRANLTRLVVTSVDCALMCKKLLS